MFHYVLNALNMHKDAKRPWRPLMWKQGIFSDCIPRKFDTVSSSWRVLCTVILWTIIRGNFSPSKGCSRVTNQFNDIHWRSTKLQQHILLGVIDYSIVKWETACRLSSTNPKRSSIIKVWFVVQWACNDLFAVMVDGSLWWTLNGPWAELPYC